MNNARRVKKGIKQKMRHHDFKNDTWDDFNREAKEKKIWIFGASVAESIISDARKFCSLWIVEGIVDNDKKKCGKDYIKGWEVKSPSVLLQKKASEIVVLIGGYHTAEISTQLSGMGIENYFSVIWMDNKLRSVYKGYSDSKRLNDLKKLLADRKSKDIVEAIVNKRKAAEIDYSDICEFKNTEYFLDEFWLPKLDEVFIDGGGYTGDTIEEFIRWTHGKYKRIYSYEPEEDKYHLIKYNLCTYAGNENIRVFNAGLWSERTVLGFELGDETISGRIVDNSNYKINTITIDESVDEPVTFIKLDIEGAEVEAIKGGRKHIMDDKPKLAIAIYHRLNDLWEIPMLLHEMVPEYKFYIRHSGFRCYGTNLYAFV